MKGEIIHFRTISELQLNIVNQLNILKKKAEEYSEIIGEKMRSQDTTDDSTEISELKQKLEGSVDPKKKKQVKKKDQRTDWYDLGSISVYNGIGTKGELVIYFKALEEIKSKIEKMGEIKNVVDDMISKGVKRELGCTALLNNDLILQVSFVKALQPKTKFSYKSIFSIPSEIIHEIKI